MFSYIERLTRLGAIVKIIGIATLLAAAISLAATPGRAASERAMTPSELLFSGYWMPANVSELPQEIILPESWSAMMKKMAKTTARTKMETGSCLTWIASSDDTKRVALIRDYQALMSKRSMMPADRYLEKEHVLRLKIEDEGRNALGAPGTWVAGKMQEGGSTGIPIELSGVPCDGETLAFVHSHPANGAAPSDSDFYHFLSHPRLKASFSIFGGEVCGIIDTSEATQNDTAPAKSLWGAVFEAWELSVLRRGVEPPPEMRNRQFTAVAATVAHTIGAGLYCGSMGHPLKLHPPMKWQKNDPLFFVLAKGAVVALSHAYPDDVESADFPYTPEIDTVFSSYLRRAKWLNPYDAQVVLEASTPGDFYWMLLTRITEYMTDQRGEAVGIGQGVTIPDSRAAKGAFYNSFCGIIDGSPGCNVAEEGPARKLLGWYLDGKKRGSLVVRTRDGYRLREDEGGQRSERACRFDGTNCIVARQ